MSRLNLNWTLIDIDFFAYGLDIHKSNKQTSNIEACFLYFKLKDFAGKEEINIDILKEERRYW